MHAFLFCSLPYEAANDGIVMAICHITGIREAEATILLFSVICAWFSKALILVFVTKINSQTLNAT